MGGGHHFEYPKWVWSPSGGWWPKPQAWKRNAGLYMVWVGAASLYLYTYATPRTVAYVRKPVPVAESGESDSHH